MYLGTQRIILVLLHDFPDFLSQSFFALCDVIPSQCIQLHNLILSAFPVTTSLRLPDPLQPGLKIELLPEIHKSPQVLTDYTIALSTAELRAPLDKFLQTRAPATLPASLKERLLLPSRNETSDTKYSIPLINAFVFYTGVVAINQSKAQTGQVTFDPKSTSSLLLRQLIADMDPEGASITVAPSSVLDTDSFYAGRYFVIAAAANQLRYPNAHTYWFSSFLLSAFAETSDEVAREQIVRALLERIIVSRPHAVSCPCSLVEHVADLARSQWGVLFTFSQLLTDPQYKLLSHAFVTCT